MDTPLIPPEVAAQIRYVIPFVALFLGDWLHTTKPGWIIPVNVAFGGLATGLLTGTWTAAMIFQGVILGLSATGLHGVRKQLLPKTKGDARRAARSAAPAVAFALLLIAAPPAVAQIEGSLGGIKTIVTKDGVEEDTGQGFLGATVKVPMTPDKRHIFGFAAIYDTESESEGMALRWYWDPIQDNGLTPGFGIGGWRLDADNVGILEKNTTMLGAELLLDFDLPLGDGSSAPATAVIGYYTKVTGDDGTSLIRFGAQLSPSLLNP